MTKKQRLKQEHLKPKKRLREERLKREYTKMYMADLIGLKNRKGYSEKEDGLQPFKD
ncbi:TPA: XRE family transcriptional regulator, partial [Streptococcus pyogenes]|nr:XRE family transcriptional regulator [Streptococcus pyogenes]